MSDDESDDEEGVSVSFEIRQEAAKLTACVFRGAGDVMCADDLLGTTILFETYLNEGADAAAAMLGWETKSAQIVLLSDRRPVPPKSAS